MDKILVNSEQEFVALFKDYDLSEAESFLGVQFAYTDGTYQEDDPEGFKETMHVSREIYKKYEEDANFPETYPCLVLLANEHSFDRTGSVGFQMLEFIYPKDFQK